MRIILAVFASLLAQALCQDATGSDDGLLRVSFTEHESFGDPEVTPGKAPDRPLSATDGLCILHIHSFLLTLIGQFLKRCGVIACGAA